MPYIYSTEERQAQVSVKPKTSHSIESRKSSLKSQEGSPQIATQPKFIIANMFGPIDWAIEVPTEETPEPAETEGYWLVDANMFGPMDWAVDLEAATKDAVPLKPAV